MNVGSIFKPEKPESRRFVTEAIMGKAFFQALLYDDILCFSSPHGQEEKAIPLAL